jgi:hypothetical protein
MDVIGYEELMKEAALFGLLMKVTYTDAKD